MVLYCSVLLHCVDLPFYMLFLSICSFGCSLFVPLLQVDTLHVLALLAILRCTSWSYKATATAAVTFLGWYCAAVMHVFSFMVVLIEFFSCSCVW
jgi:hypothetical protein